MSKRKMGAIQVDKGFLDISGERFSFSFQGLDLTTLDLRKGDFSIDFSIPDTAANRKRLDLSDDDFLSDNRTFQKIPATIIFEGLPVRQGYLKIVSNANDGKIDAVFFGGNAEWIDLLSGSIKDVDLSDYDHTFNATNILASRNTNDGYCYPLIDYGTFSTLAVNGMHTEVITNHFDQGNGFTRFQTATDHPYTVGDSVRIIDYNIEQFNGFFFIVDITASNMFTIEVEYSSTALTGTPRVTSPAPMQYNFLRPSFYVHTLLTVMFREIGWKLDGEVMEDFWFTHLILAHSNTIISQSVQYATDNSVTASKTTPQFCALGGGGTVQVPIAFYDSITDPNSNWDGNAEYTPPFEGMVFDITVSIFVTAVSGSSANPARLWLAWDNGGTWVKLPNLTEDKITGVGAHSVSVRYSNLDNLNNIAAVVHSTAGLGNVQIGYGQIEIKVSEQIDLGGDVNMSSNLPDISKTDLMRYVFNHKSIVPITNPYSKTLTLKFFKNIKHQTPSDWTAKVSSKHVDFVGIYENYGKRSWFNYKEDENDPILVAYRRRFGQGFGDGYLSIDNDFIPNEKEIYRAPFAATASAFSFKGTAYVPYIPVSTSIDFSSTQGIEPRILLNLNNLSVSLFNTFVGIAIFYPGENTLDALTSFDWAFFTKTSIGTYADNIVDESLAFSTPQGQSARGLLDRYFSDLNNLLQRGKIERFMIKMNAVDLASWDQGTPVFINYKGGSKLYFRNKLVNFEEDKGDQEVELIPYG